MQGKIDKALYMVRRASQAPIIRDRESYDHDSTAPTELMRLCNTKRIALASMLLLSAGAIVLLMPSNIRYVPLKVMLFTPNV